MKETGYSLEKFTPLDKIVCYDDFDEGTKGWIDLTPNFRGENLEPLDSYNLDMTKWGPVMLSSATFPLVGTHGSMDGTYSLKIATRPKADKYEEKPAPGSMAHAIKRITTRGHDEFIQFEMWFTYKPEQDRGGLGEEDIRAFGVMFDIQDKSYRYMPAVRYVNSVNGELKQFWQYAQATDVTDKEWEFGEEEGWHKTGIDPQWHGRRYSDGSTDGFKKIKEGSQKLCYNETADKINWNYFRFKFNLEKREYAELEVGKNTYDLEGIKPTLVEPYANINSLFNPVIWIETDTDRRAFFFVDSVVISTGSKQ